MNNSENIRLFSHCIDKYSKTHFIRNTSKATRHAQIKMEPHDKHHLLNKKKKRIIKIGALSKKLLRTHMKEVVDLRNSFMKSVKKQ